MMVKNALFPQGAVEVNGWKMSVRDLDININSNRVDIQVEWNFDQGYASDG